MTATIGLLAVLLPLLLSKKGLGSIFLRKLISLFKKISFVAQSATSLFKKNLIENFVLNQMRERISVLKKISFVNFVYKNAHLLFKKTFLVKPSKTWQNFLLEEFAVVTGHTKKAYLPNI